MKIPQSMQEMIVTAEVHFFLTFFFCISQKAKSLNLQSTKKATMSTKTPQEQPKSSGKFNNLFFFYLLSVFCLCVCFSLNGLLCGAVVSTDALQQSGPGFKGQHKVFLYEVTTSPPSVHRYTTGIQTLASDWRHVQGVPCHLPDHRLR